MKAGLTSVAPNGSSHSGDEPGKVVLLEIGCALGAAPKGPADKVGTPETAAAGEAGLR